jgi:hypothetical protein
MTYDKPTYEAFDDNTLRFYIRGEEIMRLHLTPKSAEALAGVLLNMARKGKT